MTDIVIDRRGVIYNKFVRWGSPGPVRQTKWSFRAPTKYGMWVFPNKLVDPLFLGGTPWLDSYLEGIHPNIIVTSKDVWLKEDDLVDNGYENFLELSKESTVACYGDIVWRRYSSDVASVIFEKMREKNKKLREAYKKIHTPMVRTTWGFRYAGTAREEAKLLDELVIKIECELYGTNYVRLSYDLEVDYSKYGLGKTKEEFIKFLLDEWKSKDSDLQCDICRSEKQKLEAFISYDS